MAHISVKQLTVYPIKSLAGIHLNHVNVTATGLAMDRKMVLVDSENRFITQRKYPQLARLRTRFDNDQLVIESPSSHTLTLPLVDHPGEPVKVTVWRDQCHGSLVEYGASGFFSDFLGFPCQLVRYDDHRPRAISDPLGKTGDIVSFADGFPLLIISEASLAELNQRVAETIPMASFRPNLVVDGLGAFEEDSIRQLKIGDVVLEGVKPCSRCVLTTVDPQSGTIRSSGEPLKTLSRYRNTDDGIMFGVNATPRSYGTLTVGSTAEISQ